MSNSLLNFLDNLIMGTSQSNIEKTNNTILESKKISAPVKLEKNLTKPLTALSAESINKATQAGEDLLNAILGKETNIVKKPKSTNQVKKS